MIQLGITQTAPRSPMELVLDASRALSEAAVWCALVDSIEHNLRSPEIDPSSLFGNREWAPSQQSIHAWIGEERLRHQSAVRYVTQQRSDALRAKGIEVPAINQHLFSRGKLLFYMPMETVTCGASEASSRGFFDGKDAPPWDTWFWYADNTIFSWIPEDYVTHAQAGIDNNPVDCIHWGNWRDLPRLAREEK